MKHIRLHLLAVAALMVLSPPGGLHATDGLQLSQAAMMESSHWIQEGTRPQQADTGAIAAQRADSAAAAAQQPKESILEALMRRVEETSVTYFPRAAGALIILVLGWLLAVFLAWILRTILKRTKLDDKLVKWTSTEDAETRIFLSGGIAKGFFYLIMLFVLVAVFEALQLTILTDPINLMLGRVFEFIPQLLGGALLFLVAWIVASVIRLAVTKVLLAIQFDERFKSKTEKELPDGFSPSKTTGNILYWITFLVFLPAILSTLGMEGLVVPVQDMLDKILVALPNILAGVLIFLVGWFIARIVGRFVTNVLAALGTDKAAERIGLKASFGKRSASQLIGTLVYALIIIPVAIAALNALQIEAISVPAIEMLTTIMTAVPSIFAAALLVIVAYIVARLLKDLVSNILDGIGFNRLPVWLGFSSEPSEGERSPATIGGYVVLVAIVLFALVESLELLGFALLADLMKNVVAFGGKIVLALVILGIGLYLAKLAHQFISSNGTDRSNVYAQIARIGIIFFVGAMALREMGIADDIINLAFGILLGAIAVAAAIAFGIGSRDIAGRQVEKWLQQFKETGKR